MLSRLAYLRRKLAQPSLFRFRLLGFAFVVRRFGLQGFDIQACEIDLWGGGRIDKICWKGGGASNPFDKHIVKEGT